MSSARDRVTATALKMFSERGFAAVSMRDLARELGIQAPSLYSHYPSKDALLEATIAPLMDAVDKLLAEAPTEPVSEDERREWLAAYVRLIVSERVALRIAVTDRTVAGRPHLGERLRDQSLQLRRLLIAFGAADDMIGVSVSGYLCWPSLWLPEALAPEEQERLVDTAVDMLSGKQP
jgi:AcrR family transcriptional regulator